MYLLIGYLKSASESVNLNFSKGGQVQAASRLLDIANLFEQQFKYKDLNIADNYYFDVVENIGEWIADSNLYENNHSDSYFVDMLITATNVWLHREAVKAKK